jgi:hypothetical protein
MENEGKIDKKSQCMIVMEFPCPFCKRISKTRDAAFGHLSQCKKHKKWRKVHTGVQFIVFMHTGWRKRVYYPDFSTTKPVYPAPPPPPTTRKIKPPSECDP